MDTVVNVCVGLFLLAVGYHLFIGQYLRRRRRC
jgi:hypothetical protein